MTSGSSAALYFNPEAYDTSGSTLMGRHAAGESFLRGYARHARADTIPLWNVTEQPDSDLQALWERLNPTGRSTRWIRRGDRKALAEQGCIHIPSPQLAKEAWARRVAGERSYSITGITHTTATTGAMDVIGDLLIAPVQPWDALICTSRAVRASIEVQLEATREYLRERFGVAQAAPPRLPVIPLGIDVDDYVRDEAAARRWRTELDLPDDALVALYVGRFNIWAKMNPVPMAMTLERAARRTGRKLAWVLSGWAQTEDRGKAFETVVREHCPSVECRFVDGRLPETRRSIWSVGDIFISLSDNVQETFGLTPIEAMAAGLPSLVSDWDGYKDTVRHQADGFRAPVFAPRAGLGGDLAYRYANGWDSYERYVGLTSQLTAVDLDAAERMLIDLIENPELRRGMGRNAQKRARGVFDWSVVIPEYEQLWEELATVRSQAGEADVAVRNRSPNPWRLDPFQLFASYPSEWVTPTTMVALAPGMTKQAALALIERPVIEYGSRLILTRAEVELLIDLLSGSGQMRVDALASSFNSARRSFIERGLLWLTKYGVLTVFSRAAQPLR